MAHRTFRVALQSSLRSAITTRPRTASKIPSITLGSLSLARNTGPSTLPHRQFQRGLHATESLEVAHCSPTAGTPIMIPDGYAPWLICCKHGLTEDRYAEIAAEIEAKVFTVRREELYPEALREHFIHDTEANTHSQAESRSADQHSSAGDRFELRMYYMEPSDGHPSACQLGCFLPLDPHTMLDKLMLFDDVMCVVLPSDRFLVRKYQALSEGGV